MMDIDRLVKMSREAVDMVLQTVLEALVEERHRMEMSDLYSLGNVYGMNNAVDLVAKMAKVDPLTLVPEEEPRHG